MRMRSLPRKAILRQLGTLRQRGRCGGAWMPETSRSTCAMTPCACTRCAACALEIVRIHAACIELYLATQKMMSPEQ